MKIAFLIMRSPEYRVYGPVIEAALARGWEVECWHDYSQARDGLKGYQFPSVDAVPVFRNGRPVVRSYQGRAELRTWLEEMRADVVNAWEPAEAAVGLPLPAPRPLWVGQQYNLDSLCMYSPESLLSCDLLTFYSRWWLDWAGKYFQSEGTAVDGDAWVRQAEARSAFVGFAELDAARSIDPAEVRRRWGIPPRQPVVVLFVFPQGVGWSSFWPKNICAEPSRLKQVFNIARHRRPEYLPHVWRGWNDLNVVRAIRRFCDRNGAYLLVKARRKTPIPAYAQALADQCRYDERVYPPTVLDALSIASLSVSFYSSVVLESVAVGVPHLCVTFTKEDYNPSDARGFFERFYTPDEGGAFQFRGVTTAWSIPETIGRLATQTLGDFAMDGPARARYLQTFLTHDTGDSGIRIVDAIGQAMRRQAQPA